MAKVCRYMYCQNEQEITMHCIPEEELDGSVRHWTCECDTNIIVETTNTVQTHTA